MQTKPQPSPEAATLRRSAEKRLQEQNLETQPAQTDADTQRLVHELQVHQIELEMQNEELQHARNAMEAALEKYSDLYDFAPAGYVTLDREGTIREANLTSASLLGIERSRLLNRRFGLFVAPAALPDFNAFLKQVFESKARAFCEVTLLKEGKPPVEARIEAVVTAAGQECRAAVTDITGRKQAERDRFILAKLESMGILADGLAHDYSNLLSVILLNLELAQTLVPPGEEFLGRRLQTAERAALLAQDLTHQLVTIALGDAPLRTATPLPGIIQAAAQWALSGFPVKCEYSLPHDLWPVDVDVAQIGQALRNLLLNARESMPKGGTVSVRAENVMLHATDLPALPPGEYVRVSIADRGSGMAKEMLPKIFDPYFSTKQRGERKGLGLGLTICHAIIHKHGGAIAVESEEGVGTTIRIHLPASQQRVGEAEAPAPKVAPRPGRILVTAATEPVRNQVGATLRRLGHEAELVADGARGIEIYDQAKRVGHPFAAVILEGAARTGAGGQKTIQALLQIDPAVKALVISGSADDPAVREPERYGFKAVLDKSFDMGTLKEALARVMGQRPQTADK